jgi:hypothetical protein
VALAFTFCKDRPLDREAFRNPRAYLQRTLTAPKVTLSSRPIVQRHVNAFLLGSFMRERAGDALKMQIGAFLGCPADPKEARPPKAERPLESFIDWLERPATASAFSAGLAMLTQRSALEGATSMHVPHGPLSRRQHRFESGWGRHKNQYFNARALPIRRIVRQKYGKHDPGQEQTNR